MFEICNLDRLTIKIIENVINRQGLAFNGNLDIYGVKAIDVCKRKCIGYIKNNITKDDKIKKFISKLFIKDDIQILDDGKVILNTDIYSEIAKYFLRLSLNMKVISDNIKDVMKYSELITTAMVKNEFVRIIPKNNLNRISQIADIDYEVYEIFLKVIVFIFLDNKRKDKLYHFEKVVKAIEAFWPNKLKMIVQNDYIKYSEFVESVVLFNLKSLEIELDDYQILYIKNLSEFIK